MKNIRGLINCNVLTMGPKKPAAQGLLVENDKIQFVGRSSDIRRKLGRDGEVIDLKGNTVIPGFIDSHTHLLGLGLEKKVRFDLSECRDKNDLLERVRAEIKRRSKGETLIGINWDHSKWREFWTESKKIFTLGELDKISPDNPLVLRRICGHIAYANTAALTRIDKKYRIVNRKTGLLLEDVVARINRIFLPREDEIFTALNYAIDYAHQQGVTSIHEMVDRFYFDCYMKYFMQTSRKRIRVYANFSDEEFENLIADGMKTGDGNKFLKIGGIKIYADGSIGARTAALLNGYAGERNNKGILLQSHKRMTQLFKQGEENGFQILIHAIGDRALNRVLGAFVAAGIKRNILRHRIEHAEVLTREKDLSSIAKLNFILSLQPNFIGNWGRVGGLYEKYLGRRRWAMTNRLATIKNKGIKIIFGSDCMPLAPLYGIHWAVNHPIFGERIRNDEAIVNYTRNGAFGSFEENYKGMIAKGMQADLVVLNQDPTKTADIDKIKVLMTIQGGKIVFGNQKFLK